MTSQRFCHYDLRTTDVDAARAFYAKVVGLDFDDNDGDARRLAVWPLHERARAAGAPAHWLGHIGVTDVEPAASHLVGAAGQRLGPTLQGRDGANYAVVRDRLGAVIAVRASAPAAQPAVAAPVVWHQLHTVDLEAAWALYAELFGWHHLQTLAIDDPPSQHRIFAWQGGGRPVGSVGNTARLPGVHTHWLFYFPVTDIEGTLTKVRESGGRVAAKPATLPNGDRIAPCEDGQGAAFGVYQASPPP